MTKTERYSPHQASEKLIKPYTLCRASADWAASGGATMGETAQGRNGRFKVKATRRADLERAKQAAGPDRSSYNQSHVDIMHQAMFPGLPNPTHVVTRDFGEDLWRHLGQGPTGPVEGDFVISVALDLSVLGSSSPLRRWTGPVAHQVALWKRNNDNDQAYVLDGMAPYSTGDPGYWAPRSDLAKAAKAIEEGLVICELYPVAGWTAERLKAKEKNKTIAKRDARIVELRSTLSSVQDESEARITELETDLAACEALDKATREEVLDESIQALEALK